MIWLSFYVADEIAPSVAPLKNLMDVALKTHVISSRMARATWAFRKPKIAPAPGCESARDIPGAITPANGQRWCPNHVIAHYAASAA